ncbi:hypothetical protein [Legionella parisiensis]|uniref:Uncharacterized protein n=1 Tax=Legionella parisiensis TaxID=45071 RepID=A0A1E5JS94_9GAMM|nr:hypothetical protein [Legionella parisiensis]KTD42135.1 hypothetical protein Lpar_3452 [Legionella parisiensis]OEH47392.1 hypothetical protein lpari_01560 [Legionella parisiensis]STX75315.1 Uncharacterised protein [Legionella parisiensis]
MFGNKPQSKQVPKLITLTAEVIKKTNPHLFFTLYGNKELPPQIENEYVNPPVQELVKQHEHIYLANVKERKDEIKYRSARIETDYCFKKCAGLMMLALGSGVHLGIYYILRSSGVPYSTTITFLATLPATVCVTACFSPCAAILLAKGIARCITPGVPEETVDLTEIVTNMEEQRMTIP